MGISANHRFDKTGEELLPAPGKPGARPPADQSVNQLDRFVAGKLLDFIGHPPILIQLWDGSTIGSVPGEPVATMQFQDRGSLYRILRNPELNWGDCFAEGRIEVKGNLVDFLQTVYLGLSSRKSIPLPGQLPNWHLHLNSKLANGSAASDIYHHYDIGNNFYRRWLDQTAMQYTCAYYPDPGMSLEQAQLAKMDYVCRKLQLSSGQEVVEAGCGWGGFALHMAEHYGVRVKAYNISREQIRYAKVQAQQRGLGERVEFILDDFRNIDGHYDVFVSIGMLEHVGSQNYPLLGGIIGRVLKPGGRGLIHSIGRNRAKPVNAWIERRIFPGAYPPSLREIMDIFEPNHLSVLDVENLRLHYALTLQAWLNRFEQSAGIIQEEMDELFVRTWRLYLSGSLAAFRTGDLQLFQVLFTPAHNNDLPWSRAHQLPG